VRCGLNSRQALVPRSCPTLRLWLQSLGFSRRSSQEKRFAAVLALGDLHGRRVLDMGCGFGDLLPWLRARHASAAGVDICRP
jgi:2-polyprenyl-3-methyl-5-hydroxy-6-metoxy-1,4-benzoquinol methylase